MVHTSSETSAEDMISKLKELGVPTRWRADADRGRTATDV